MKLNTAKKLTAGALALSMMFAMAVPMAFATDEKVWTKEDDYKTVDIKKVYTAINDEETTNPTANPEETFYLEQVSGTVKSGDAKTAPELIKLTGENETDYVAKVTYAEGEATKSGTTKAFTITLPEYTNVGIYEYMLREIDGKNAGVSYRKSQLKLVVTVINVGDGTIRVAGVHTESAGDKSDTFGENKYSAGKLDVTKTRSICKQQNHDCITGRAYTHAV